MDLKKLSDEVLVMDFSLACIGGEKSAEFIRPLREELLRRLTPQPVGDHPEDNCDKCGHRMRFNYAADSDLWNKVVKGEWSILCIDCFIELCQSAGDEPKFVVFHIPGSQFHHELEPEPVGEIGDLLDTIMEMMSIIPNTTQKGSALHSVVTALRTAVASMQADRDITGYVEHVEKLQGDNTRLRKDTERLEWCRREIKRIPQLVIEILLDPDVVISNQAIDDQILCFNENKLEATNGTD